MVGEGDEGSGLLIDGCVSVRVFILVFLASTSIKMVGGPSKKERFGDEQLGERCFKGKTGSTYGRP